MTGSRRFRAWPRPAISYLGAKLFIVILTVNVAIAVMVFLAVSKSLDEGFLDYLENAQANRAEILADALGEEWARHQSWQWLRSDSRAWRHLVRRQLWPGGDRPSRGVESQLGHARDFVLHDADGLPVIGLPPRQDDQASKLNWLPIRHEGKQVGVLGYRPPEQLMARMDHIFLARQQRNLQVIVGSLALASLLLAGGLSWWLGRRTRGMVLATRRLAEGDYALRLNERGRDELSRLAQDFNRLAVTLDTNRQARQRWVSDIAHELRTPLAVLRGEIEAMQDGIRALDTDNLHSLSQEVDQLERLVGDLRLLAQSDAGDLQVELVPVDLADNLSSRLEEARSWLQAHDIELQSEIDGPAMMRGDSQRLRQLWSNLLNNTRAYTRSPGRLRVELEVSHDRLRVIWEDSAPGVPEAELPRLTERLYRVEGSRNRHHGGSGLGLSIATALVHAHDGDLEASASSLGGLRWTLTFPRLTTSQAQENHP